MVDTTIAAAPSRLASYLELEDEEIAAKLAVAMTQSATFYVEWMARMVEQGAASPVRYRGHAVKLSDYCDTRYSTWLPGYRNDQVLVLWFSDRARLWAAENWNCRVGVRALYRCAEQLAEHFVSMREAEVRNAPGVRVRAA